MICMHYFVLLASKYLFAPPANMNSSGHHPAFGQHGSDSMARPQTVGHGARRNPNRSDGTGNGVDGTAINPHDQIQHHFSSNIRPQTVGHATRATDADNFNISGSPNAGRARFAHQRPTTSPTGNSRPTSSPTSPQKRIELRRELRFANWTVNTPFIPSSFTRDTAVTLNRKGKGNERKEGNTNSQSDNSAATCDRSNTRNIHAEERRLLLERPGSQADVVGGKFTKSNTEETKSENNQSEQLVSPREPTLASPPPHVFGSVPGVIALTGPENGSSSAGGSQRKPQSGQSQGGRRGSGGGRQQGGGRREEVIPKGPQAPNPRAHEGLAMYGPDVDSKVDVNEETKGSTTNKRPTATGEGSGTAGGLRGRDSDGMVNVGEEVRDGTFSNVEEEVTNGQEKREEKAQQEEHTKLRPAHSTEVKRQDLALTLLETWVDSGVVDLGKESDNRYIADFLPDKEMEFGERTSELRRSRGMESMDSGFQAKGERNGGDQEWVREKPKESDGNTEEGIEEFNLSDVGAEGHESRKIDGREGGKSGNNTDRIRKCEEEQNVGEEADAEICDNGGYLDDAPVCAYLPPPSRLNKREGPRFTAWTDVSSSTHTKSVTTSTINAESAPVSIAGADFNSGANVTNKVDHEGGINPTLNPHLPSFVPPPRLKSPHPVSHTQSYKFLNLQPAQGQKRRLDIMGTGDSNGDCSGDNNGNAGSNRNRPKSAYVIQQRSVSPQAKRDYSPPKTAPGGINVSTSRANNMPNHTNNTCAQITSPPLSPRNLGAAAAFNVSGLTQRLLVSDSPRGYYTNTILSKNLIGRPMSAQIVNTTRPFSAGQNLNQRARPKSSHTATRCGSPKNRPTSSSNKAMSEMNLEKCRRSASPKTEKSGREGRDNRNLQKSSSRPTTAQAQAKTCNAEQWMANITKRKHEFPVGIHFEWNESQRIADEGTQKPKAIRPFFGPELSVGRTKFLEKHAAVTASKKVLVDSNVESNDNERKSETAEKVRRRKSRVAPGSSNEETSERESAPPELLKSPRRPENATKKGIWDVFLQGESGNGIDVNQRNPNGIDLQNRYNGSAAPGAPALTITDFSLQSLILQEQQASDRVAKAATKNEKTEKKTKSNYRKMNHSKKGISDGNEYSRRMEATQHPSSYNSKALQNATQPGGRNDLLPKNRNHATVGVVGKGEGKGESAESKKLHNRAIGVGGWQVQASRRKTGGTKSSTGKLGLGL